MVRYAHGTRRVHTWSAGIAWMAAVGALCLSAAIAAPASAAKPTPGAKYRFNTLNNDISFTVARDGRTLRAMEVSVFTGRCSNGREGDFAMTVLRRARVSRTGAFSEHFVEPEWILDTFVASEEVWVSGKFIRKGRAARITLRGKIVGEGGTVCDSGTRTVIATRAGRRGARFAG
jgi:hypothetical protein